METVDDENQIVFINPSTLCRVCLKIEKPNSTKLKDLTSIFENEKSPKNSSSPPESNQNKDRIIDILEMVTHTAIRLDDTTLPSKICKMCISYLKVCYSFLNQFNTSQNMLLPALEDMPAFFPILETPSPKPEIFDDEDLYPLSRLVEVDPKIEPTDDNDTRHQQKNTKRKEDKKIRPNSPTSFVKVEPQVAQIDDEQPSVANLDNQDTTIEIKRKRDVSSRIGIECCKKNRSKSSPSFVKVEPQVENVANFDNQDTVFKIRRKRDVSTRIGMKYKKKNRPKVDEQLSATNIDSQDNTIKIRRKRDVSSRIGMKYKKKNRPKAPSSVVKVESHVERIDDEQPNVTNQDNLKDQSVDSNRRIGIYNVKKRPKPFKCQKCNRKFGNEEDFTAHVSVSECDRAPVYVCELCGKVSYSSASKYRHKHMHEGRRHMCDICRKSYTSHRHLRYHVATKHNGVVFTALCNICGKVCNSDMALRYHMKVHNDVRNFACSHCGRKFISREGRDRHVRTHTKERPFECDVCGRRFTGRSDFRTHKFTHSENKPYNCDMCGKGFASTWNYKVHMARHSGPFRCSVCPNRSFIRKRYLDAHIKEVHKRECTEVGSDEGEGGLVRGNEESEVVAAGDFKFWIDDVV